MACAIARLLSDGETVFHGVASNLPLVAILLARSTHAPGLVYLNIAGAVDPRPTRLTKSTVDPALLEDAVCRVTLTDIFDLSARGRLDTVFLSAAQIDLHGNFNLSVIGSFERPKVRLPGGAGSALLASTARRTILWRTRHDRRTFVDRLDFITACGNVERVVTPLAVLKRVEGLLQAESLHPGFTFEDLQESTGFELERPETMPTTGLPTAEELKALDDVDPDGIRYLEFA
jgi:glutaconate CoA-transferase subunit B